jgi:hypothetical protein
MFSAFLPRRLSRLMRPWYVIQNHPDRCSESRWSRQSTRNNHPRSAGSGSSLLIASTSTAPTGLNSCRMMRPQQNVEGWRQFQIDMARRRFRAAAKLRDALVVAWPSSTIRIFSSAKNTAGVSGAECPSGLVLPVLHPTRISASCRSFRLRCQTSSLLENPQNF